MAVRFKPNRISDEAMSHDERAFKAVRSGLRRTVVSVFSFREIRRIDKSLEFLV
ncbi:hypothetical protein HMPREF0645_0826 [Hallella bergensis DSM 17361]|uniref:Uncharacterized protein n=1 Tax=Hallella bergensis DSM 17361 TaxID=585502 RepID=D1PV41_9BACT|nr:hypothetical protein HMPREF0645_0826 [Hallella bergensis DSM 17361]